MSTSRRDFLSRVSVLGAAAGLGAAGPAAAAATTTAAARRAARSAGSPRLRVLFLGGTGFVGPPIVERLVDRGHEVTLFNRGRRSAELFPELETIVGNRIPSEDDGLSALEAAIAGGRRWDVVIDTANVHRWTEDSARILAPAAAHYVYTSSMSVYADNSRPGQDETSEALATMPDDVADGIDRLPYDMQYFGAVKVRSERAAERHFPGRTTVLRPGLIVGPGDRSHRFTYWPWRVRQGGAVLCPGSPDDPVMFIDVRDLADFFVTVIEGRDTGVFNVTGPSRGAMTMGRLVETCRRTTGSDARFTWVDGDWLAEREVYAWGQMPVWIPPAGAMAGFHRKSIERAVSTGLRTRPLSETVRATLAWLDLEFLPALAERGETFAPGERAPGITRARETALLAEWTARGDDDADAGEAAAPAAAEAPAGP